MEFKAKLFLFDEADRAVEVTLADLVADIQAGEGVLEPEEYGHSWILIAAQDEGSASELGRDYADETARDKRPVLKYMEILVAVPKDGT